MGNGDGSERGRFSISAGKKAGSTIRRTRNGPVRVYQKVFGFGSR
jgi:hypothetical protein